MQLKCSFATSSKKKFYAIVCVAKIWRPRWGRVADVNFAYTISMCRRKSKRASSFLGPRPPKNEGLLLDIYVMTSPKCTSLWFVLWAMPRRFINTPLILIWAKMAFFWSFIFFHIEVNFDSWGNFVLAHCSLSASSQRHQKRNSMQLFVLPQCVPNLR